MENYELRSRFKLARKFVGDYWFDSDGRLSRSVTKILGYFDNGRMSVVGIAAYKRLVSNMAVSKEIYKPKRPKAPEIVLWVKVSGSRANDNDKI